MKKIFYLLFLMSSCCTTTIVESELYGTVEDVVTVKHKNCNYRTKVWGTDGKYYTIYSNKRYEVGSYIQIK